MLANLDRDNFISLLEKLGSEDDEEINSAAREIHALVTVAGVPWDQLLVPEGGLPEAEGDEAEDDEDDDLGDDEDDDLGDGEDDDLGDEDSNDDDEAEISADDDEAEFSAADDDRGEALSEAENKEALSIIGKLLSGSISADTKEELEEYKTDITGGDFAQMDLNYLRALQKRLGQSG